MLQYTRNLEGIMEKQIKEIRFTTKMVDGREIYDEAHVIYEDGTIKVLHGAENIIDAYNTFASKVGEISALEHLIKVDSLEVIDAASDSRTETVTEGTIASRTEERPTETIGASGERRRRPVGTATTSSEPRTTGTRSVEESSSDRKKSSKGGFIKGLCIGLVASLIACGSYHCYRRFKDNSQSATSATYVSSVEATPAPLIPNSVVRVDSRNTDMTGYNTTYRDNLNITISDYQKLLEIINKIHNNVRITQSEFDFLLNNITMLAHANIAEVEKVNEDEKMSGPQYNVPYQDLFPADSVESYVLSKFSTKRSAIVDTAYNNNKENTINAVNEFLDMYCDFVFNHNSYEFSGKHIGFYEMNSLGRYVLLSIGQTMLETNHQYKYKVYGKEYGFMDLINLSSEYYNTVVVQLETNKISSLEINSRKL